MKMKAYSQLVPIFLARKTQQIGRQEEKRGRGIEEKAKFRFVWIVLEELVEHHLERSAM